MNNMFIMCGNNSSIELDIKHTNGMMILLADKIIIWIWCCRLLSKLLLLSARGFHQTDTTEHASIYIQ